MTDRLSHANWNLIPEHMQGGVRRWIMDGIAPGSFMTAVLCNDLKEALGRADDINRDRLFDIVSFLYSYAPSECWGLPERFDGWREAGGLNGIENKAEADYQRQQEALMESGGPDDSTYRRDMIAAGRGHLLG